MKATYPEYLKKKRERVFRNIVCTCGLKELKTLLKYSEASLTEISEYLCFSSQSHFGKVFKVHKNMTPKQYRDYYKSPEFVSREENLIKMMEI